MAQTKFLEIKVKGNVLTSDDRAQGLQKWEAIIPVAFHAADLCRPQYFLAESNHSIPCVLICVRLPFLPLH